MINIAKLLEDAPKGMKLYSPLFGEVKFKYINGSKFGIVVEDSVECSRSFDKYGRYFTVYNNAECLLFPSKECRTWENFKLTKFKFKVGDWIVRNDGSSYVPIQVYAIKNDRYLVTNMLGSKGEGMVTCQDECRLWTIQDAKDGDVLVSRTDNPFIYNGNIEFSCAGAYVGVSRDGRIMLDMFPSKSWTSIKDVKPATKEQYDLLFAKIKEAGYQWDSKKKELRKTIELIFKVGDEIFEPARNEYFKIKGIEKSKGIVWYVTTRTRLSNNDKRMGEVVRINVFYQNEYSIVPKSHYDISSFYAGMPVLVRADNVCRWNYSVFSNITGNKDWQFAVCNGVSFTQCIPFEGNEHLLGTSDPCDKQYINW